MRKKKETNITMHREYMSIKLEKMKEISLLLTTFKDKLTLSDIMNTSIPFLIDLKDAQDSLDKAK